MNSTPDNPPLPGAASEPGPFPVSLDETLHLIAHAPVPEGLKERVHASLLEAASHKASRARILPWPAANQPAAFWPGSGWMRAAAAAAIVFVVAGGGWGVYQRVERPTAKVIEMPVSQPATSGSFSSAAAIRTPQTVKGPVLVQPITKATGKKQARKRGSIRPGAAAPGVTAEPVSAAAGSR